jgi:hypothetical protein
MTVLAIDACNIFMDACFDEVILSTDDDELSS